MANIRQTILVRTDLNLPVGLLTAQVAHIHMELFRNKMLNHVGGGKDVLTNEEIEWLKDPYIFVHGVPNKEFLEFYMKEANKFKVSCVEWRDTVYLKAGTGEAETVPFPDVLIGCSLGPADSDKIKVVTGNLPLL